MSISIKCNRCRGMGLTQYVEGLELCQDCDGSGLLVIPTQVQNEAIYNLFNWDGMLPGGYVQ